MTPHRTDSFTHMTARPIFHEIWRRPVCAAVALIISLFAIFFAIAPVNAEITATHMDDGKILLSNGTYWIRMDPVSDRIIGDDLLITGITNFPVKTEILSELDISAHLCRMNPCDTDPNTFSNHSMVTVQSGSIDGNNTFLIVFPTKNLMLQGDYYYSLSPTPYDSTGTIWYRDRITLFPKNNKKEILSFIQSDPPTNEAYWIWINPGSGEYIRPYVYTRISHLSTLWGDSHVLVSGLTNLPVGESIPYSIINNYVLDDRLPENIRTISLASDRVDVIPGENAGVNKFVIDLNSSQIQNEERLITFWNPKYNASVPNAFLAASIWFAFNQSTNVTVLNSISVFPTSTSASIPSNSPLSLLGTCLAILVGSFLLTLVRK